MRIAHIESSLNWGGQELRVIEQIEWLINNGHESWIIARPDSKIIDEAKKRNLPYFELNIKGSLNFIYIKKLFSFLKSNNIDILDSHSNRDASYSLFVKLFTNIKVIRSRHVTCDIKNDFFRSLVWKYGNNAIITTAQKIKEDISNLNLGKKENIHVAPAGVDEKRFSYNLNNKELKKELGIPQESIVISNIGMIRPDKGQLYFVKMCELLAQKYENIYFMQVGEATKGTQNYYKEVLDYLNTSLYKDKIKFIGYKSDIENYISISDIIVIASTGTEAQTRLVSQAFLMKKNIVATNIGGLPEMINDMETGLLCNAKDEFQLAQKISLILDNKELKEKIQENAYEHANKYSTFKYMMDFMLNVYNEVLKK